MNWIWLVRIFQLPFHTGLLPESETLLIMVILPKGEGGHCVIGIVEFIWKLINSIINIELEGCITLYDNL